jgi:hypothetical protein
VYYCPKTGQFSGVTPSQLLSRLKVEHQAFLHASLLSKPVVKGGKAYNKAYPPLILAYLTGKRTESAIQKIALLYYWLPLHLYKRHTLGIYRSFAHSQNLQQSLCIFPVA